MSFILNTRLLQVSITALLFVFSTCSASAQTPLRAKVASKESVQNLISGISSENTGLKRSAIYMAGKYAVSEVLPVLFEQMAQEKDPSTKILIALSIYNIGQPASIAKLKALASSESNVRVQHIINEIYNQYSTDHDVSLLNE